jgi:hypothetical protein
VLEVLEGGPLVLRVTLEYKGEKDIDIGADNGFTNAHITPRANWKIRPVAGFFSGRPSGRHKLSPGDKWSEVHYLHQQFCGVAKGKVTLEVSWRVREPGEKGKEIARPVTKLEVDIPAATEERLRALRRRLADKLDQATRTEEERRTNIREVVDYLRDTKHAGLAPVVWRLIEATPDACPMTDFLQLVYAAEDKGVVNRRLVKLACDPNYPGLGSIFWYWRWEPAPPKPETDDDKLLKKFFCDQGREEGRKEKVRLSAEEIEPLLKSENVWIRTLTGVTFPDQRGKEWTERLLRDLRESQQPLPDKLFARLLADLDDDDFAVRQKATEELQRHGERVQAQVARALQGQPSPEAKGRLKHVLDAIAKGPPPIVRTTLSQLGQAKNDQARVILRVLAEGQTDSWASKEAKAALQRQSKP